MKTFKRINQLFRLLTSKDHHLETYNFIDLSLTLARQNNVKVSTVMDYISKHKNNLDYGIVEVTNDKFMISEEGIRTAQRLIKDPHRLF